ncbi:unnamed protein product, partial [Polarella glacialis]
TTGSSALRPVLPPIAPRSPERKQTMASSRGALQLSRRLSMRIELPEFTKSRFSRRSNMMDEDRVKWYNWNLACIGLTA